MGIIDTLLLSPLSYSLGSGLGLGFKRFIYYYLVAKFPLGLRNVKKLINYIKLEKKFYLNNADVKNCGEVRGFSFIYIDNELA